MRKLRHKELQYPAQVTAGKLVTTAGKWQETTGLRNMQDIRARSPRTCWKEVLWDALAILMLQENKPVCIQLVSSKSPEGMRVVK